MNGFWIRRIYFTYDRVLSPQWAFRFRLEMNHPGGLNTYRNGFVSGAAVPYVKDAYLKWVYKGTEVYLGIAPTPTFVWIERLWGYRPVEKTPLDLHQWGSTRDMGIAIRGGLPGLPIQFHVMVGNGKGVAGEENLGKKFMLALGYYPEFGPLVEVYADYDDLRGRRNDRWTLQLIVGYRWPHARVGLQWARQVRQRPGRDFLTLEMVSAFAAWDISPSKKLFLRLDRLFDPSPAGYRIAYLPFNPDNPALLILAGLDYRIIKNFHLMPNVESILYSEFLGAAGLKPDVIPRMTVYAAF